MTSSNTYDTLAAAVKAARRVYICGNGGSAANAIHMANDLLACGIRAHALTADVATLTAIANDFSFDEIFSRQLSVYGEPGDLLLAMSGSGKSRNILLAIETASKIGMNVIRIFGSDMELGMQELEEEQLFIAHEVMRWLQLQKQ